MSFYTESRHTTPPQTPFSSGSSPETFAGLTATVEKPTEKPITGRNGDHLQFSVNAGPAGIYQVDVNTESRDGSQIGLYIAVETLTPVGTDPTQPFGPPTYGLIPDAALSYAGLGLTNSEFTPTDPTRIESQLEADLNAATFVSIYGLTFDDGGPNGKGIHETHFAGPNYPNQDGALALFAIDPATQKPIRTWYFFLFQGDQIQ